MTFLCLHCNYSSDKRFNVKRHIDKVHKDIGNAESDIVLSSDTDELEEVKDDDTKEHPNLTCTKCNKKYSNARYYKAHIKNCQGCVNKLECPHCHKQFKCRSTKSHHIKSCATSIQNIQNINTTNNNTTNNIDNSVTNNINNNNIIHIHVNNFDQEQLGYITAEFIKACFDKGKFGIDPMLDKIYFDKEHPENHNVQLTSLKHSLVEVLKNGSWVAQGLNETIDRMITNSSLTIRSHPIVVDAANKEDMDFMHKLGQLSNLEPSVKKTIRERTKGRLVARRNAKLANDTPTIISSDDTKTIESS